MEISPRQISKRATEPVDEWLQNEGFFRKHAPKDPTCLFRAVSEQVYLTQHDHIRVRKECIDYMRANIHLFQENISISVHDYLEQMACFTEWGGNNEIQAMSLLYKKDFVIFSGLELARISVTDYGFKKAIYLCHTAPKQYESVYSRDYVSTAAYCQSIVYQTLYKNVFKMTDIDNTVHKMLHDRSPNFRHDKFFLKSNIENREQLKVELYKKLDDTYDEVEESQSVTLGITPFPYRVAKALDPNIYRNTDLDIWHELKREVRNAGWMRYNTDFQIGGKCLIQLEVKEDNLDEANNNNSAYENEMKDANGNESKALIKVGKNEPILYSGHIQEMSKNEGPVVVFIEEFGEKRTVPYSALKPLVHRKNKQNNWNTNSNKKNVTPDQNGKWKKSWGSSRRMKEHGQNPNPSLNMTFDRNNNNNISRKECHETNSNVDASHKNEALTVSEKYKMQKFNSYENYPADPIVNVAPVESAQKYSSTEAAQKRASTEEEKKKTAQNDMNGNNVTPKKQQQNYAPTVHVNTNNNAYSPGAYFIGNNEDVPTNQIVHPINFAVSKSVDVNGSDLPFSDTQTLRFFYNLGLEYFHAQQMWNNYPPNEQTMMNIPYFVSQNGVPNSQIIQNGLNVNGEEQRQMEDSMPSKNTSPRRKEDCTDRNRRSFSPQKAMQKNSEKYSKPAQLPQGHDFQKNVRDFNKSNPNDATERKENYQNANRDLQRNTRNGLAPRFKKNVDGRNCNYVQQIPYHKQEYHQQMNYYRHNGKNRNESASQHNERNEQAEQAQVPPQQQQGLMPGGGGGNAPIYPITFNQQPPMYGQMTLCTGEAEVFSAPFYSSNPNIFPVSYPQPPDMNDASNANAFPPQPYLGIENFPPACHIFPPYIYPQASIYSGPANPSENWYPVPAPPHFNVQYAPMPPSPNTGTASNLSQQNNSSV